VLPFSYGSVRPIDDLDGAKGPDDQHEPAHDGVKCAIVGDTGDICFQKVDVPEASGRCAVVRHVQHRCVLIHTDDGAVSGR
jgi:hypothetical protein